MNKDGMPRHAELLEHILSQAKEGVSDTEISYSIKGNLSVTPVVDLIGIVCVLTGLRKEYDAGELNAI